MREERSDVNRLNRKHVVSKRFFSEIHKYCGMIVDLNVFSLDRVISG